MIPSAAPSTSNYARDTIVEPGARVMSSSMIIPESYG